MALLLFSLHRIFEDKACEVCELFAYSAS